MLKGDEHRTMELSILSRDKECRDLMRRSHPSSCCFSPLSEQIASLGTRRATEPYWGNFYTIFFYPMDTDFVHRWVGMRSIDQSEVFCFYVSMYILNTNGIFFFVSLKCFLLQRLSMLVLINPTFFTWIFWILQIHFELLNIKFYVTNKALSWLFLAIS